MKANSSAGVLAKHSYQVYLGVFMCLFSHFSANLNIINRLDSL